MQVAINNTVITVPEASTLIPPSSAPRVPLNGERLDNAAYVAYGSHLEYPALMKKNNIGFMFDTPSDKKIAIW